MRQVAHCAVVLLLISMLATTSAFAQEERYSASDWPIRVVDRPLILGPSMFEIRGDTLRINMSSDDVGDPVTFAPDIYYGVNRQLTIGIDHADGLCLSGDGCGNTYDDFTVDALYNIIYDGVFKLAAHGGLEFRPLDPFTAGMRLGFAAAIGIGNVNIDLDPGVYVAFNNRGDQNDERPDQINAPVRIQYQLTEQNALLVSTGLFGTLSDFGDTAQIPVGFGAVFVVARRFDVGAEFRFERLLGANNGANPRTLIMRAAVRL